MEIRPVNKAHESSKWWRPPNFGWKYLNWGIIGIAIVVSIGIMLMPKDQRDPRIQAAAAEVGRNRVLVAKQDGAERIRKENEEMGLIYIEPGTNPFPTKPPEDE